MNEVMVDDLRKLADCLENSPHELAVTSIWEIYSMDNKKEFNQTVDTFDKPKITYANDMTNVLVNFDVLRLKFVFLRERTCKRVLVGTKVVKKEVPTAYETQTIEEPVYEWDCSSK